MADWTIEIPSDLVAAIDRRVGVDATMPADTVAKARTHWLVNQLLPNELRQESVELSAASVDDVLRKLSSLPSDIKVEIEAAIGRQLPTPTQSERRS